MSSETGSIFRLDSEKDLSPATRASKELSVPFPPAEAGGYICVAAYGSRFRVSYPLNQMKQRPDLPESMAAWSRIPGRIRSSLRGLSANDLDLRGGPEDWSIRETVHHLVEANLVASNMIIAALATDGGNFDWTWVNPDKSWMRRVGYDRADVDPAIKTLRALCRHLAGLLAARPDALARTVKLNDAPGATRYVQTVEKILRQEVEHANQHLGEIRDTRRQHAR